MCLLFLNAKSGPVFKDRRKPLLGHLHIILLHSVCILLNFYFVKHVLTCDLVRVHTNCTFCELYNYIT